MTHRMYVITPMLLRRDEAEDLKDLKLPQPQKKRENKKKKKKKEASYHLTTCQPRVQVAHS